MYTLLRILVLTAVIVLSQWMPALSQTTVTRTATWVDNSNSEDGFRVYAIGGNHMDWIKLCDVAKNVLTCSWQEPMGTARCYVAVAYNVFGESGTSSQTCLTTTTGPVGFEVK